MSLTADDMTADCMHGEGTRLSLRFVDGDSGYTEVLRIESIDPSEISREEIDMTPLTGSVERTELTNIKKVSPVKWKAFFINGNANSGKIRTAIDQNKRCYFKLAYPEGPAEYAPGQVKSLKISGVARKGAVMQEVEAIIDGDWSTTDPA